MSTPIATENLVKSYPGKMALKGVDLQIQSNTIHGFLGPNGAGKSTAMNIISGLMKQTRGQVYILGKEISKNSFFVRENLGFLPETPSLYGDMKVEDFLFFRASLYFSSKKIIQKQIDFVLEKIGLNEVKKRSIGHLSKGFKQRVGIASALIFDPPILILDEPISGLDPSSIREIRQLMTSLKTDHTIMFSSHQLGEVAHICDEISIIKEGKLILSDSFKKVQEKFSQKNPLEVLVRGERDILNRSLEGFEYNEIVDRNDDLQLIKFSSVKSFQTRADICRRLVENGVDVFEIRQVSSQLEDIFVDLVEG